METLLTGRLELRPWQPQDAQFLLDLESREEIIRFLGPAAQPMISLAQAHASIQRRRAAFCGAHGIWIITRRADGQPLGNLLLKPVTWSQDQKGEVKTEIGWHLHPDAQGLGYATEAARSVISHAAQRGLRTLMAVIDPRNEPSVAVCQRLGFEDGGQTSDYYDGENLLYILELNSPKIKGFRNWDHE